MPNSSGPRWRPVLLAVALAVPLAVALGYYGDRGMPGDDHLAVAAPPSAAPPTAHADAAPLDQAAARLAARLASTPGDAAGWRLLARTYRELGRPTQAAAAEAAARGAAAVAGENGTSTASATSASAHATAASDDQARPSDVAGWRREARARAAAQGYAAAAAAYASALTLAPTDPDLLADAADARAAAMDKQFDPQALAWLDDALTRAPDHPKALWLAGTAALHGGDRERARSLWRRLLGVLPADSPDAEVIRANLRDLGDGAAPAVVVSGRVELAAELADAVQPDDTLFVFARAADGPAMPLAVLRRRAADLPLNFSLDDSMAMQPGHGISSAATVIVGARLSRSGRALAQPGDLEGSSAPVATSAADNLAIRIERKVVH